MLWNCFECIEFEFEGYESRVVIPDKKLEKPSLIVKTEYWNAFPETEIKLLQEGFYLGYIKNSNRWGTDADLDRKARFVEYVTQRFSLKSKCIPVGMSCGGLIAVKFAARYPQLVSCIYIDAPVINYMSCPCGFGIGERIDDEEFSEILGALGMSSISELICYRDMPLDNIPELVKHKIPIVMVSGDSDTVVPYTENGIMLEKAYKENKLDFELYIKPGCNHHPHGLENPQPIVDFIKKHSC